MIAHHISGLDGAVRLFRDVLDSRLEAVGAGTAELTWSDGRLAELS